MKCRHHHPLAWAPFRSPGRQLVVEPGHHLGVAARKRQIVDNRTQIESGPPDQQGAMCPGRDFIQGGTGRGLKLLHGELVGGLDQVDQVIIHPAAYGRGRRGGADIHAPVHRHGVHRQ